MFWSEHLPHLFLFIWTLLSFISTSAIICSTLGNTFSVNTQVLSGINTFTELIRPPPPPPHPSWTFTTCVCRWKWERGGVQRSSFLALPSFSCSCVLTAFKWWQLTSKQLFHGDGLWGAAAWWAAAECKDDTEQGGEGPGLRSSIFMSNLTLLQLCLFMNTFTSRHLYSCFYPSSLHLIKFSSVNLLIYMKRCKISSLGL